MSYNSILPILDVFEASFPFPIYCLRLLPGLFILHCSNSLYVCTLWFSLCGPDQAFCCPHLCLFPQLHICFYFFCESSPKGGPNPSGFLPNAQSSGPVGQEVGSSLSPLSTQLHLDQMCPWVGKEAHGLPQQSHQPVIFVFFWRSQKVIDSRGLNELQHSSGVWEFGNIRL